MRVGISVVLVGLLATVGCATQSTVSPSPGPWRFSGTVSAMDNGRVGRPIAGARLTVVDGANSSASVTSSTDGRYAFERLDSGRFSLVIEAPGYVSANPVVDLYRDIEVDFALTPQ